MLLPSSSALALVLACADIGVGTPFDLDPLDTPSEEALDGGFEVASDTSSDVSNDLLSDPSADPRNPFDVAHAQDEPPPDATRPDLVLLSFTLDDSANRTYGPNDGLALAGEFVWNPVTNVIEGTDWTWTPPHPMLWDDGPLSAGGHEPAGARAGDHLWGVALLHEIPAEDVTYWYRVIRGSGEGSDGELIWPNTSWASVTVPAGAGDDIVMDGLVILPFGPVDYRITVDGHALDPRFADYVPQDVEVMTWDWWRYLPTTDDGKQDDVAGDGVFSIRASANVGPGCDQDAFEFCDDGGLGRSGMVVPVRLRIDGVTYAIGGSALSAGLSFQAGRVLDDAGQPVYGWTALELSTIEDVVYAVIPRIRVDVVLDDRGSASLDDDGLAWAGTFRLVEVSVPSPWPAVSPSQVGLITYDEAGNGPFPRLRDDGPASEGGHEPEGATAGDHVFGCTLVLDSPTAHTRFHHRVVLGSVDGSDGEPLDVEGNRTFEVLSGQIAPVEIGLVVVEP